MEPLTRDQREAALRNNPQASPENIDEYEALLAARFAADPSLPKAPDAVEQEQARDRRLQELYNMLFG